MLCEKCQLKQLLQYSRLEHQNSRQVGCWYLLRESAFVTVLAIINAHNFSSRQHKICVNYMKLVLTICWSNTFSTFLNFVPKSNDWPIRLQYFHWLPWKCITWYPLIRLTTAPCSSQDSEKAVLAGVSIVCLVYFYSC